jgi:CheY-like chemotaxis protein
MKDCIRKIGVAGETLLKLINDILDISKIESGKLTLNPVRYETTKLIGDTVTINLFRLTDKPIEFKLEVGEELLCSLLGDDLRVKQILSNLLGNAFKYTNEGNVTLSVSTERVGENDVRLDIAISDTGIGIRKEDIEKLFEDYNQVDTQANRHIEGTGLGLSITKGLMGLMSGEISVESEYGKGSTFRVSLVQGFISHELIGAESAQALRELRIHDLQQETVKPERPDLSHVRVLIVDDFLPNLDVAKWILGRYKMSVECVTSGQDAIDRISSMEPAFDAVFMDHMMPGMDGVEAVRRIRALGTEYAAAIPIIALTANAVIGNEQMFLDNGFQAFLPKPINLIQLDKTIRQWIMKQADVQQVLYAVHPPEHCAGIEIAGIDAQRGLYLFDGDREMYIDFLRSYTDFIPAEIDKLRVVSEQSLPSFAIDVHTVKGASAGIGADVLAGHAKRLELMAKAGDLQGVISEKDKFIQDAESLIHSIEEWLSKN